VVEDDRLIGVVSRADVIRMLYEEQKRAQKVSDFYTSPFPIPIPALERLARDSREIADRMTHARVRDIMTPKPQSVRPDDSLETAARLMWEKGFHRLPVVSDGHLEGILSSLDVVRLVAERGLATT
jgi:CBS domain-containing protein